VGGSRGYAGSVDRRWNRTSERVQTALAALLACALVVLPLTGGGLTASELAAVSLVVIALAAAVAAPGGVVVPRTSVVGVPAAGAVGPPLLRTRPTDPAHHPLAPRAPGLD
jgi:hypothetical protein